MRRFFIFMTAITPVLAACAPDPYNLYPQAMKVEKIVMGESALELQAPRPQSAEYILYEGVPFQDGGVMWQPFYLTDIEINPTLGSAILERKSRYAEVFGLLSKGAVGEASNGKLTPRVGLGELTIAERDIIERENADRETLILAFMEGKQVPRVEHMAVRRVFAYSRYQLLPGGIWVEKTPGEWMIKGGAEYRERVMARDPVYLPAPSEDVSTELFAEPVIESPAPRVREEAEIEAPAPRVR